MPHSAVLPLQLDVLLSQLAKIGFCVTKRNIFIFYQHLILYKVPISIYKDILTMNLF